MSINKIKNLFKHESTLFYTKALACIVLIAFWSLLINTTSNTTQRSKNKDEKKKVNNLNLTEEHKKEIKPLAEEAKTIQIHEAKEKKKKEISKFELPKFANLEVTPQNKITDLGIKKNEQTKSTNDKLVTSSKPENTITKDNEKIKNETKIALRNEIPVSKNNFKPILKDILEEPNENTFEIQQSWLPKYLIEKKEITEKVENIRRAFDKIASQLEIVGIINNNNEKQAVIIKNKVDDSIEILKIGEYYLDLKVLSIKENEVKLGNPTINETYTLRKASKHVNKQ